MPHPSPPHPPRPMLASLEEAPLVSDRHVYEPKYDGIRALAAVDPDDPAAVRLWSRLGNDKTAQFPELVRALQTFSRRLKAGALLDGEIVALDDAGEPAGFQSLQGRIHLTGERAIGRRARTQPVAFIAFDVLRDGRDDVTALPLSVRRARLERIFGNTGDRALRLSEFVPGDGRELYRRAIERGWEGLIAKQLDSRYTPGRRGPEWKKLKIQQRQECIVGGWTDPRGTRAHFGALLLGVRDGAALEYVGHIGTGFTGAELDRLARLLAERATDRCPFRSRPRTNERPHWVIPDLVVEVVFTEWTDDRKLRHPTYLGLRTDVPPTEVRRGRAARGAPRRRSTAPATPPRVAGELAPVMSRLSEIEARGGEGVVTLANGARLEVGNLDKVFWPAQGITKGELMRYYVWAAPLILPAVTDRPLVMRRFPNGIHGRGFYQQRAPDTVPPSVRVEHVPGDTEVPSRLIGGSLATLLHMTQMAVVSQDPWFSRVPTVDFADHIAIDLDPMPGVPFTTVLDVARWVHDELARLGTPSVPKTSGAEGLHIYIPLPPRTLFEAGRLFCEIIATIVADKHPHAATVERRVNARGRTVYVDYLQNTRGKTLATAYSARASDFAGVSTPLTWQEVHDGVDRRDFTIRTLPDRVAAVGDLWSALLRSPGADLAAILSADRARSRTGAPRRTRRAG